MKKFLVLFTLFFMLTGCGYNKIQQEDESVKAAWSEVLNQYQRRADLVPQLVSTVKGYAKHEEQVLTEVTNARAKVGSVQLTPDQLPTEQEMQQFTQAQGELTSALNRLNVVVENYPDLKANEVFSNLQTQLEGTENRITHARRQYIQAVQTYNTTIREIPVNITAKIFGYKPIPNFSVDNEQDIQKVPEVNFE
ncbi:LemA family protein [Neisseriaceae bacterium PsAf]|nr:LemA family protein [Neisseriaceae bacterium PsAf]MCV2502966.1 LemA family protein [Neisseriaceae bacterium]